MRQRLWISSLIAGMVAAMAPKQFLRSSSSARKDLITQFDEVSSVATLDDNLAQQNVDEGRGIKKLINNP